MPWYKEAIQWAEEHPYIAGGSAFGGALAFWFLFLRTPASSLAGMTNQQAFQLQKLQLQQPLTAAKIAEQAQTAQARIAASPQLASVASGTAQARIAASLQRALAASGLQGSKLNNAAALAMQRLTGTQQQSATQFSLPIIAALEQAMQVNNLAAQNYSNIIGSDTSSILSGQAANPNILSFLGSYTGPTYFLPPGMSQPFFNPRPSL